MYCSMSKQVLKERWTLRRSDSVEKGEGGGGCKHFNSLISMSSDSNICPQLDAANRRPQQLLKYVLSLPLLKMRCSIPDLRLLNCTVPRIDSLGYVFTFFSRHDPSNLDWIDSGWIDLQEKRCSVVSGFLVFPPDCVSCKAEQLRPWKHVSTVSKFFTNVWYMALKNWPVPPLELGYPSWGWQASFLGSSAESWPKAQVTIAFWAGVLFMRWPHRGGRPTALGENIGWNDIALVVETSRVGDESLTPRHKNPPTSPSCVSGTTARMGFASTGAVVIIISRANWGTYYTTFNPRWKRSKTDIPGNHEIESLRSSL